MLQELLEKERLSLDYFFDHIDLSAAEKIFDLMNGCQGTILFTGVGKSSIVAKKIAVTMTSTGSKALYLSPTNALHGDIGIVNKQDIFVMLSKSGESDELLNLLPYLKQKGVTTIAFVSNASSRLSKACDHTLHLPLAKELCPFDLAPTTSTVIQMIIGDLLAIALMQSKNFTMDQFALNHPAGRIGKRISLKVEELMLKGQQLPISKPHTKLIDSLVELSNKRCGCLLVVDDQNTLQGIFTDGDLRRALQKNGYEALNSSINNLMTSSPRWIAPQALAWQALQLMEAIPQKEITVLPVLDDNKRVLGLIKMHDILQSGI